MKEEENRSYPLVLVDDEDNFRNAIARRLGKRGLVPLQASSGQACLDILGLNPVAVVVLDVKMPGMGGMDTLKAIKQRHPGTQVIMLTGAGVICDGVEGIKAGAFDYLTKPVEIEHLANKISQAFDMIRLEAERKTQARYREKLEKKMIDTERLAALGTLSTGIAHEINNPLAVINESAGFMSQVLASPEMQSIPRRDALIKGLEKIDTSIQRARKITLQLLGHVKKQESACSQVDIIQLLNDTLGLLEKEIRDKDIRMVRETGPAACMIWTDPYQVRQVLINLLDNAIDAVKERGTITLTVLETEDDVRLDIEDDGMGIPEKNLGKIFDPFFSSKPFEEGTGLGLFVVHKILSKLNGKIDVQSRVGKGSCFRVSLPRHESSGPDK
ncbi:sensor histidine kinase [Desulfospira joergensenii]|uniref:sensor histidine kinase n=1 Tax=Desulfospira joergensenii TaxID=53329 RepID=UPI0003B47CF2|nr:ATP-binding protein [Desulfospira joergensenii]